MAKMRFDLEHDWQGNMSTPRAKVGEKAKTQLLLVLCTIWLCMGLIGHAPWKPFEAYSISVVKNIIDSGNLLAPHSASSSHIASPPLYYLSAAALGKLLSPILPLHDAARIVSGLWMVITLLMVGMTGRELWGTGFGRQTTFVFIGSIGLVLSAHTLMPAVSALTGLATSFYSLALAKRRPYRASVLLGLGVAVAGLSTGLQPLLIILLSAFALPCFFGLWRNTSYAKVIALALVVSSPFLLGWAFLCNYYDADIFSKWWALSLNSFALNSEHVYFAQLLLWYAWPALPLAAWGLWRFRSQLIHKQRFQLMITFFIVAFTVIGFGTNKEVLALPLLIPLTAMAGGSIETLKRGTAGALSWFGFILFGLMSGLIWLGWSAMITGSPAKIKERITFLSGMQHLNFSLVAIIIASIVTLIWLFSTFRTQYSNRSSATNWAIGMTCVWTLLMTLWLPLIDSARSYAAVFLSLKQSLPEKYSCVKSQHLGASQTDLLHYYTNINTLRFESEQSLNCDLYLIQDEKGREKVVVGSDWQLIWSGKRISERKERFRLFQHI